jgi:hypothetical protein
MKGLSQTKSRRKYWLAIAKHLKDYKRTKKRRRFQLRARELNAGRKRKFGSAV